MTLESPQSVHAANSARLASPDASSCTKLYQQPGFGSRTDRDPVGKLEIQKGVLQLHGK